MSTRIVRYKIPTSTGPPGSPFFVKGFGGAFADVGTGIAFADGDLIITGTFQGTVDFTGNGTGVDGISRHTSAGGIDMFLAKYTSDGMLLWVKRFGTTGEETPRAIALDPSGNILIGGRLSNTANFGGTDKVSAGQTDFVVAKYNASGVHQWSNNIGGFDIDNAHSICSDSAGNVIIVGEFRTSLNTPFINFSTGGNNACSGPSASCLQSSFDSVDTFIAKYSSAGTFLWAKNFACGDVDKAQGVIVDALDHVIAAGYSSGAINFGGTPHPDAGGFLVKLHRDTGNWMNDRQCGVSNPARVWAMAKNSDGDIILAGDFFTRTDLGGGTITGGSTLNMFIAKYSGTDFSHQWSKPVIGASGAQNCTASGIAIDPRNKDITIIGSLQGSYTFGKNTSTEKVVSSRDGAAADIFVAKYSNAGDFIWGFNFGSTAPFGAGSDFGRGVTVNSAGRLFITGSFSATATFGGFSLTSNGSSDIFFAGLEP